LKSRVIRPMKAVRSDPPRDSSLNGQTEDDELRMAELCQVLAEAFGGRAPAWAIVLGSGLGGVRDALNLFGSRSWSELPHMPRGAVSGHGGELAWGTLEGVSCAMLCGRMHCYEGYTRAEVTHLLRGLLELGTRRVVLTNAAGGLHPRLACGDAVVIRGHLDRLPGSKIGCGTATPQYPYDTRLSAVALQAARAIGWSARAGIYLATTGPLYETPAEARFMRAIGADVVGMSTVPEAEAAARAGAAVVGVSIVTNLHLQSSTASHSEVLDVTRMTTPKLTGWLRRLLAAAEA